MSRNVLVVEDAVTDRRTGDFVHAIKLEGVRLETKDWSWPTVERLRSCAPRLIVANAASDCRPLLQLFTSIRDAGIAATTLAIVPESLPDDLFSTVVRKADDFLIWPAGKSEFVHRVGRLLGPEQASRSSISIPPQLDQMVGEDPVFLESVQQVPLFAKAGVPVLITGETGTGKELFAHALHSLGTACNGSFIPVDCGAIPENLIENELFGHARGAYTDARAEQKGLIALAHGGTLFLDEVDALTLTCQSKLLRFLQEKTYRPLGADYFQHADVRIIAATNHDLPKCIEAKTFRADLFYRLNVLRLHLAPLRQRPQDIAILARHFVNQLRSPGQPGKTLSAVTLSELEHYDWPGNVRELYNTIQRAVVCTPGVVILPEQIWITDRATNENAATNFRAARADAIQTFERSYIESLLRKNAGNVTRSAREAGKDRRAFGRLVKKYAVDRLHC
jgi:two-component system response regulator GlrR